MGLEQSRSAHCTQTPGCTLLPSHLGRCPSLAAKMLLLQPGQAPGCQQLPSLLQVLPNTATGPQRTLAEHVPKAAQSSVLLTATFLCGTSSASQFKRICFLCERWLMKEENYPPRDITIFYSCSFRGEIFLPVSPCGLQMQW